MDINERLAKLERQNRWLKGGVVACVVVFLLCQCVDFAAANDELRKEIMSKGLKVASTEKLFVHVTLNQHTESKSGLSKKLIRAQVEKQLLRNGQHFTAHTWPQIPKRYQSATLANRPLKIRLLAIEKAQSAVFRRSGRTIVYRSWPLDTKGLVWRELGSFLDRTVY